MLKEEIRCWSLLGDQKVNADPLSAKENPQGLAHFCDLGTLSATCDYPSNLSNDMKSKFYYHTKVSWFISPLSTRTRCQKFQVFIA